MYKKKTKQTGKPPGYAYKLLLRMKLLLVLSLCAILQSFAATTYGQKINLDEKDAPIGQVFRKIRQQSGYDFLYNGELLTGIKVTLKLRDASIDEALNATIKGLGLTYNISDKIIYLSKATTSVSSHGQDSLITGKVLDAAYKKPLPGVTVSVSGGKSSAQTLTDGTFRVYGRPGSVLTFTYLGYAQRQVKITSTKIPVNIILEESVSEMKGVVVNGIFTRKAETATGSQTTVTKEKLLEAGTVNVIQSLRNIDPSFSIIDNSVVGSNPNALPDINLRGQSGIPDLNGNFATNPNLPLFILDGFETTLQRVIDLDPYRVERIDILKDAAAKAVYGAKAANGVVVIQTTRPIPGKIRINYNANIGYDMPDLSSYNMANAAQKLEVERLAGIYTSPDAAVQYGLTNDYNLLLANVISGVNTDWMAKPLQNGVVQRHSIRVEGGDQSFTYGVTATINNTNGVMKGSSSNTFSGNVNLNYRSLSRKFNVMNDFTVQNRKGANSPWGTFSDYVDMNPYLLYEDGNGNILKNVVTQRKAYINLNGLSYQNATVLNPAYNSTLNTFDLTTTNTFTNNTSLDWLIARGFRAVGRFSYTKQIDEADKFLPAEHTSFLAFSTPVAVTRRGSYTKGNGKSDAYDGQLNLSYGNVFNKHSITLNGGATVSQITGLSNTYVTEGFANQNLDLPSLGLQYQLNSRLLGTESTVRDMGFFAATNYSFDQRYNVDLTYRLSQSSLYGSQNRWANLWSAGVSWNLHHESFLKKIEWVDQIRLRASTGFTGTQGFNPYMSVGTYTYIRDLTYSGNNGVSLISLANPDLKWQRKQDNNFGLDFGIFKKVSGRVDYYVANTDGALTDITIPLSTGFSTFKANLGKVENKGIELNLNYNVFQKAIKNNKYNSLTIFASAAKNKNTLKEISNALQAYNKRQNDLSNLAQVIDIYGNAISRDSIIAVNKAAISRPKILYVQGQSMNAIYAVPSLGIDPATGREVFRKLDGSTTYDWDINDQVVVGNSLPKWQGNFGFNLTYNGFRVNAIFRYQFGGQVYNSTLVDRVENANIYNNVDLRVLTARWQKPGDHAFFKDIADRSTTRVSSRFVEDNNTLTLGSLQIGYDLDNLASIRKLGFSQLRASISSSELFQLSTVRIERGTAYPFARTVQFTLNANF
ncbi:SusC/RagA family TonB-linked outer membrane protein [Pedobacter zeae]|uniref:SusC/RagA family TonB-linked outer membrane protein n=2 Tax=Pedobacter zeae TaxID=1737356 RepID=A0ABQ1XZK9_9SPHI|nr:SusC/RagA family TonB-linked outer membrane protein [Pedobacter zeae]GGH07573.1 SusC/RagA family TonB-linked outer membrane protein [Pedobacter zeae]